MPSADRAARVVEGLAVIVLAGGESRRFGSDKLVAELDGRTLLEHALDGIPTDALVAVVGPKRPLSRAVTYLREDPPGGGPAAGLITGLCWALDLHATVIATLPGDAPGGGWAAMRLVDALVSADPGGADPGSADPGSADPDHASPGSASPSALTSPTTPDAQTQIGIDNTDAVVALDAVGGEQVLQLALRPTTARALIELAGAGGGHGESVRRMLHQLAQSPRQVELPDDLTSDIDTTAQLRARG